MQLQKQLDIDFEIEVLSESRAMRTLSMNPNVIMLSISRIKHRENDYHWLEHVLTKRWVFYSRENSPNDASTLQDILRSKAVGVVRGGVREKWLLDKKTTNLVSILNHDAAVEMLMRGRVDYLFYESFGVFSALKKLGIDMTQ